MHLLKRYFAAWIPPESSLTYQVDRARPSWSIAKSSCLKRGLWWVGNGKWKQYPCSQGRGFRVSCSYFHFSFDYVSCVSFSVALGSGLSSNQQVNLCATSLVPNPLNAQQEGTRTALSQSGSLLEGINAPTNVERSNASKNAQPASRTCQSPCGSYVNYKNKESNSRVINIPFLKKPAFYFSCVVIRCHRSLSLLNPLECYGRAGGSRY